MDILLKALKLLLNMQPEAVASFCLVLRLKQGMTFPLMYSFFSLRLVMFANKHKLKNLKDIKNGDREKSMAVAGSELD